MKQHYENDNMSALDAMAAAQKIAFAPILFQATVCLRDLGILRFLDEHKPEGATLAEITDGTGVSLYGAGVLMDMGLSGRIVFERDERYFLGKTGHYLLHDKMTQINLNFVRDVCYEGMGQLQDAIKTGKPAGLRVFGKWKTIYEGLSNLPEPARTSWFDFDHFYSDAAFDLILPEIFALKPKHIYDVGGNTGKWALKCVGFDPDVRVTVLDLPQQVELLKRNVAGQPGVERIDTTGVNLLGDHALPGEADLWWMSQFLDCFAEEEILRILKRVRKTMKPEAKICILETFCDRQRFEAAAFSLNAGSLYFTCLANGNSRFYRADAMKACIEKAGLRVEREIDNIGIGSHTLCICSVKKS